MRVRRLLLACCSLGLVVAAWWASTSGLGLFSETLLPSPGAVVRAYRELLGDGTLQHDTLVSLRRVLLGFAIAVLIALPLAAAMAASPIAEELFDPLVELLRPVPPLAVIPLAILWFGIGEASKLAIIAFGAFFPLLINTFAGFRTVDPQLIRAARSLGSSRLQTFWHVNLHSAFGHIVVGMRLGVAMGFLVLVGAELIAADAGLGFLIQDARNRFRADYIMVGIITIGVVGYLLNRCLLWLERRVVPWREQTGSPPR